MKKIHSFIINLATCCIVAFSSATYASDEDALKFFHKGQEAMDSNNYDEALRWLNKAIEERSYDGNIGISASEPEYRWVKTPRGRKLIEIEGNVKYNAYFPNKLVTQINYAKDKLAKSRAAERQRLEEQRALDNLKRQKFSSPPNLLISYHLSGGNIIEAKEQSILRVTVDNNGGFTASGVELKITGHDDIDLDGDNYIGEIAAGGSITQSFDLEAYKSLNDGKLTLEITAVEDDGFDSYPYPAVFETVSYKAPQLKIYRESVKEIDNNLFELSFTLVNAGKGSAFNVENQLIIDDYNNSIFFDNPDDKLIEIGNLRPNESKEINIQFFANNRIKTNEPLPFKIKVTEQDADNTLSQDLALVMPQRRGKQTRYAFQPADITPMAAPIAAAVANVDINIPEGSYQNKNAVALIIGNSHYDAIDDVEFAINDAKTVAAYAKKTLGFGKITLKEDMKAKEFNRMFGTAKNGYKGKLYRRVDNIAKYAKEKPPIFIYYSGHGAPSLNENGAAYFVPSDVDNMDYIEDEGYSLKDFYASISNLPSDNVTVVIDSCFSGSTSDGKMLFKGKSPAALKTASIKPSSTLKNATVFSSAEGDQVSNWYKAGNHSLFTYHFLSGLSGKADKNKDNKITNEELKNYIHFNVTEHVLDNDLSNQTPTLVGNEDHVLVQLPGNL